VPYKITLGPNGVDYPKFKWLREDAKSYLYKLDSDNKWGRLPYLDERPLVEIEQGDNLPPRVVAIDLHTNQKNVVLDPNPGFLTRHRFARATPIEWKYGNGRKATALLYWPPDYIPGQRYPLVVQGHGYRPDIFEPWGAVRERRQVAQVIANSGIFVVQYDEAVDGWGQSKWDTYEGTAFSALEMLIDTLDKRGVVDREKVGLAGYSTEYGFFLHFVSHSKYPIVTIAIGEGADWGYFSFLSVYAGWSVGIYGAGTSREQLNGGLPWGTSQETWLQRSPGFNLDRIKTPIQFEVGTSENYPEAMAPGMGLTSLLMVWENYQGLRLLGRPVELNLLPAATHDGGPPWSTFASQQNAVDWIRFWLQGHERTTPIMDVGETNEELAEKYFRWRVMREKQNKGKAIPASANK